ncbi:MAG: DAK2 domain-containing protein [Thermanaerothrix sp.]|nr:DAK2 domain-containing protein [Thermanaerothrix sp.]
MGNEIQFSPIPDGRKLLESPILDGQGLKALLEAGLTWLRNNQQTVNALNVFPVPDGDTGTNMVLTLQAAYNEIAASGERNIGKIAHAIAQGALLGARGNSGVILSQIWRGFARALDNFDVMDTPLLVKALAEARNTAYKGVVRPVEGTILTVIKDIAQAAESFTGKELHLEMLEALVEAADRSVQKTPELLPILKQAGVVDAGGKGLFFILEGMLRFVKGLSLETPLAAVVQPLSAMNMDETMEEIEPGQDYEVVVDFRPTAPLDLEKFYSDLAEMGTSIQVGEGDGMYRMHIHVPTENRYRPIDYVMGLGTITKVSIENLLAQIEERKQEQGIGTRLNLAKIEPGQIAVVAVSPGAGLSRIFASLGVAAIVEGGQTMNPSTEEILRAFENLPTDKIIILPNNKNIILAAKNAASMTVKKVAVVPSKSVPQGLSALLRYDPDGEFDTVVNEMESALHDVQTGEITTATRSVEINGVKVSQGEVIALLNGNLICSSPNIMDACLTLLEKANAQDHERITIFYGQNIAKAEVNKIVDKIREVYPRHEIEIHEGGQPHYQLIISIE